MARRTRSNLLALAVLCCLTEKPMHPYEVAQTLRSRAKHESIKLNYGSLYNVVDALERDGLIEVRQTVREGRRPERTIYAVTEAGFREMTDWLSDLVAAPVKEFPAFEAALSFLPALAPADATELLRQRVVALSVVVAELQSHIRASVDDLGLPRLFAIEEEYRLAVVETELDFVRRLLKDIEHGDLDGLAQWTSWHEGDPPART